MCAIRDLSRNQVWGGARTVAVFGFECESSSLSGGAALRVNAIGLDGLGWLYFTVMLCATIQ